MKGSSLMAVSLALFASVLAIGKTTTSRKPASNDESVETYTAAAPQSESRFRASIGPSLGLLDGNFGWGLHADAMMNVPETPVYVGLQTGFYRWTNGASVVLPGETVSVSSHVSSVPVLATAYYRLPLAKTSLMAYAGASVGFSITPTGGSVTGNGVNVPGNVSDTSIYFEALLRPGVEFPLNDMVALAVEPTLGILKDQFTFMPHAAAQFAF